MIINPMGMSQPNAPIANGPGSGALGGQMPMPMTQPGALGGQMPMPMGQPQSPMFNAPGQGGFGANGMNMFGQNPQQASRATMLGGLSKFGQVSNGAFTIRPGQQNLAKQYAMAQQLRGGAGRG